MACDSEKRSEWAARQGKARIGNAFLRGKQGKYAVGNKQIQTNTNRQIHGL